MTDNIGKEPTARKAGRGLLKALRGLFGDGFLRKTRDSVDHLAREYREGKREAEEEEAEEAPRRVPHRVMPSEAPPPAPSGREEPPSPE